jgi:hypothetical protein
MSSKKHKSQSQTPAKLSQSTATPSDSYEDNEQKETVDSATAQLQLRMSAIEAHLSRISQYFQQPPPLQNVTSESKLTNTSHYVKDEPSASPGAPVQSHSLHNTEHTFQHNINHSTPFDTSQSSIPKPLTAIKASPMTPPDKLGIAPLGNAFHEWSQSVKHHFTAAGLGMYLEKDCLDLVNDVTMIYPGITPFQANWLVTQQSKICCAALSQALSKHLLSLEPLVVEVSQDINVSTNNGGMVQDNVYLLWIAVNRKFKPNTTYNVTSCILQLMNLSYNSNQDPAVFYNKVLQLKNNLTAAGTPLDDRILAAFILRALPDSLDIIKQTLIAKEIITVNEVFESLRRHYDTIRLDKRKHTKDDEHGLLAKEQDNKGRKNGKKSGHRGTRGGRSKDKVEADHDTSTDTDSTSGEKATINLSLALDELHYLDDDDSASSLDERVLASYESGHLTPLDFVLDTGASRHVVGANSKYLLKNIRSIQPIRIAGVANSLVTVQSAGTIALHDKCDINNVLLLKHDSANLISVSRCTASGCDVTIGKNKAIVYHPKDKKVKLLEFTLKNGIYVYRMSNSESDSDDDKPDIEQPAYHRKIPRKPITPGSSSGIAARKALDQARAQRAASSTPSPIPVSSTPTTSAKLAVVYDDDDYIEQTHAFTARERTIPLALAEALHSKFGHQSLYQSPKCTTCLKAKAQRASIGTKRDPNSMAKAPLDALHADIVGPITIKDARGNAVRIPTIGDNIYALVVMDEVSKYSWVEFLKLKSQATSRLIALITRLQTQYGITIKRFHSDGGGEFINNELQEFFTKQGTFASSTTANTPEHNGLIERNHRTLFTIARALLLHANAPLSLWGEALNLAVYIRNRTPLKQLDGLTPFESLNGYKPTTDKLHTFGCDAYVTKHPGTSGKIESKAWLGVFMGIDEKRNCFRIFNPKTLRMSFTRNARMVDSEFTHLQLLSTTTNDVTSMEVSTSAGTSNMTDAGSILLLPPLPVTQSSTDTVPVEKPVITNIPTTNDGTLAISSDNDSFITESIDLNATNGDTNIESDNESKYQSDTEQTPPDSPHMDPVSPSSPSSPAPIIEATVSTTDLSQPLPTTRSQRTRRPVSKFGMVNPGDYAPEDRLIVSTITGTAYLSITNDISMMSYNQAMARSDSAEWKESISRELSSLEAQQVATLVQCPKGVKPIKSRWVFKIKLDSNNQPSSYKSRVVAKGYLQQQGIDYDDTYAPVARMKSIRMLLSIAAAHGMVLKQLDYDTAFLNAKLDKPIYMTVPQGVEHKPGQVWKLDKALYGLKQSPMCWNSEIDSYLKSINYTPTLTDVCMYIKPTTNGRIILSLYVDDTIVAYHPSDESEWLADKQLISAKYTIKDLGDLTWLLNMKITRDPITGTITLDQSAYIDRICSTFGLSQCKPCTLPYVAKQLEKFTLTDDIIDDEAVDDDDSDLPPLPTGVHYLSGSDHSTYRTMVGSVLYVASQTRPDIAYTVNVLCRFVAAPTNLHLQAAKTLLRYLSGTKQFGLIFTSSANAPNTISSITTPLNKCRADLIAFADASWANNLADRKSTTGILITLYNNVISWITHKQATVATSTAESEYMAMVDGVKELLWCRSLLNEIFSINHTTLLLSDNQATIHMVTSPSNNHARTKHIDVRHFFIKDYVKKRIVNVEWIPTNSQLADVLTKPVPKAVFSTLSDALLVRTS